MIHIVAIGNKLPDWIDKGVSNYQKRLHDPFTVEVTEIPNIKNIRSSDVRKVSEGKEIVNKLPKGMHIVALDVAGKEISTKLFAQHIERFFNESTPPCFIIGGADGLCDEVLQRADSCWSLSKLTFPHALVRIILMEQIYRAVSIIKKHPYHH